MKFWLAGVIVALATVATGALAAPPYEVVIRRNIEYATHDGVKLTGDLYRPKDVAKAPVLIAVHGGGWQRGSPATYKHWGPLLAENGYAVFAVTYRLAKPGTKAYPGAVYDVRAAVQFMRARARDFSVDPERIGLMGDSAGAHLVSLVGLAGSDPQFSSEYKNDPHASTPVTVNAVIGFYGVYDMLAQWEHDQLARPLDQITEKFLGAQPMANRKLYFDSSPMSYATVDKNKPRFMVIWGTADDIVEPASQSQRFRDLLKRAQFYVRTVEVPSAPHFWVADPIDVDSYNAHVAPKLLLFLDSTFKPQPPSASNETSEAPPRAERSRRRENASRTQQARPETPAPAASASSQAAPSAPASTQAPPAPPTSGQAPASAPPRR